MKRLWSNIVKTSINSLKMLIHYLWVNKSAREIKHNLEIVLVELTTMSDTNIAVGSCYRPPNADKIWIKNFDNLLNDVCTRHSKIVLAGDLNFPRACWNFDENSAGVNEKAFK